MDHHIYHYWNNRIKLLVALSITETILALWFDEIELTEIYEEGFVKSVAGTGEWVSESEVKIITSESEFLVSSTIKTQTVSTISISLSGIVFIVLPQFNLIC